MIGVFARLGHGEVWESPFYPLSHLIRICEFLELNVEDVHLMRPLEHRLGITHGDDPASFLQAPASLVDAHDAIRAVVHPYAVADASVESVRSELAYDDLAPRSGAQPLPIHYLEMLNRKPIRFVSEDQQVGNLVGGHLPIDHASNGLHPCHLLEFVTYSLVDDTDLRIQSLGLGDGQVSLTTRPKLREPAYQSIGHGHE